MNGGSFPYKNNGEDSTFNFDGSIQPILPVGDLVMSNKVEESLNKG